MSRPANPVTLPLADYSPSHFLLKVDDGVAQVTLEPPRAQESADVRELSRTDRFLPRLRIR